MTSKKNVECNKLFHNKNYNLFQSNNSCLIFLKIDLNKYIGSCILADNKKEVKINSRGAKLKKYTIVYDSRYYIIKPPCKIHHYLMVPIPKYTK